MFLFGQTYICSGFLFCGRADDGQGFWAFGAGFIIEIILIAVFVKGDFLHSKPGKDEYKNLLKYSGWLGVSKIVSSIAGKLDIQMLANLAGAVATGLYSIPSRLASFIGILSGSFSSVLAPRLAGFGDKEKEEKIYFKVPCRCLSNRRGGGFVDNNRETFYLILFGDKYIDSVPIFQALAAAQIPVILRYRLHPQLPTQ